MIGLFLNTLFNTFILISYYELDVNGKELCIDQGRNNELQLGKLRIGELQLRNNIEDITKFIFLKDAPNKVDVFLYLVHQTGCLQKQRQDCIRKVWQQRSFPQECIFTNLEGL